MLVLLKGRLSANNTLTSALQHNSLTIHQMDAMIVADLVDIV